MAASVDPAAGELFITVVNRSPDRPHEAEWTLDGADAVASAEGDVLTGPDFLPGSQFTREKLPVSTRGDRGLAVTIPPHSVAGVNIRYR